jgi:integrin alpha FG-GAP repeat containing protein 1
MNIVPGDFNGDSIMDILVVYLSTKPNDNKDSKDKYDMSMFFGLKKTKHSNDIQSSNEKQLLIKIEDQPFIGDFDGDGKVELLVQTDNKRKFIYYKANGTSSTFEQSGYKNKLAVGYAHSVVDMNNDMMPDLMLTADSGGALQFELWTKDRFDLQYSLESVYDSPIKDSKVIYGQSLFADFDSDGKLEHLLPACRDSKCEESVIFMYKDGNWTDLKADFNDYRFIPPSEAKGFWGDTSISMKAGDYNLNGFLDLLTVMRKYDSKSKKYESYAVVLQNVFNGYTDKTHTFEPTFKIDTQINSLFQFDNVIQASFFDLYDDGYLDILLVTKNETSDYQITAMKNEYYDDVYFIKVMVLPGMCDISKCPFQSLPYGLNNPGAMVRVNTTSLKTNEYTSTQLVLYGAQMSQSAYMSLQLPYTIFGLGTTPNFVEHLSVSILAFHPNIQSMTAEINDWPQIIPNSQLVINPHPRYHIN